jgi:hypothetical protein
MKEPAPPMPGTYLALWIGVMVALSLTNILKSDSTEPFSIWHSIGMTLPGVAIGWVLAKVTWPSYWRQKYKPK